MTEPPDDEPDEEPAEDEELDDVPEEVPLEEGGSVASPPPATLEPPLELDPEFEDPLPMLASSSQPANPLFPHDVNADAVAAATTASEVGQKIRDSAFKEPPSLLYPAATANSHDPAPTGDNLPPGARRKSGRTARFRAGVAANVLSIPCVAIALLRPGTFGKTMRVSTSPESRSGSWR
jgi:hypothetical protein